MRSSFGQASSQLPRYNRQLVTLDWRRSPPMITEQAIEAHKATQTAAAEVHAKQGFRKVRDKLCLDRSQRFR
jgi:hypothetical protein